MADGDPMVITHNGASVLLPNPSAEIYTGASGVVDNWSSSGNLSATLEQGSDQYHAGSYSQKLTLVATQTAPKSHYFYIRYQLPKPAGNNADKYYKNAQFTIGAWVRTDNVTFLTFKMRVGLCNSSWTEISGADTVISPSVDTWTQGTYALSLGSSPDPAIYGVEVRLYTQLMSDNGATCPQIWWDDLSMYNSYTFARNPSVPDDGRMFLEEKNDRLADATLSYFRHPASQAKWKTRLTFGLISQTQMERLRQFWLAGKPVVWTPNLPKYPSTLIVKIVGKEFVFTQNSPLIGAGYKGSLELEEV